jgi:hypothetical protein
MKGEGLSTGLAIAVHQGEAGTSGSGKPWCEEGIMMMKKSIYLWVFACAATALGLAACGAAPATVPTQAGSATETPASAAPSSSKRLNTDYENALTVPEQLLLGTIELEGTSQAVDAKVASRLLPLWQNILNSQINSNVTPQDLDAVAEQMQAVMTPAQIQAIANMRLTRADMNSTLKQMEVAIPGLEPVEGTQPPGNNGEPPSGIRDGATLPPDGNRDGGRPRPGGGSGIGQLMDTLSPDQLATMQADGKHFGKGPGSGTQAGTPGADQLGAMPTVSRRLRLSPELMNVLIHLLQTKI